MGMIFEMRWVASASKRSRPSGSLTLTLKLARDNTLSKAFWMNRRFSSKWSMRAWSFGRVLSAGVMALSFAQ